MSRIYGNGWMSGMVKRTDVPNHFIGGKIKYHVPADSHFSHISQDDADRKAADEFKTLGVDYANKYAALIPKAFANDEVYKTFFRTDCMFHDGTGLMYTVEKGDVVSFESKADANEKAVIVLESKGQRYADLNGACCTHYGSREYTGWFFKDDCSAGTDCKDGLMYVLPASFVVTTESQIESDAKAFDIFMEEGQRFANKHGQCEPVYYNIKVSDWFRKRCPEGMTSDIKHVTVDAGEVSSFESVEDATEKAKILLNERGRELVEENYICVKSYGRKK